MKIYSQRDNKWKNKKLGFSDVNLGGYGLRLAIAAIAVRRLVSFKRLPANLAHTGISAVTSFYFSVSTFAVKECQILNSIVELVTVNMVDSFKLLQRSTKMLFHSISMLIDSLTFYADYSVAVRSDCAAPPVRVVSSVLPSCFGIRSFNIPNRNNFCGALTRAVQCCTDSVWSYRKAVTTNRAGYYFTGRAVPSPIPALETLPAVLTDSSLDTSHKVIITQVNTQSKYYD